PQCTSSPSAPALRAPRGLRGPRPGGCGRGSPGPGRRGSRCAPPGLLRHLPDLSPAELFGFRGPPPPAPASRRPP
ncbi:unnamed protein product, partial [Gulo gulo]